MSADEEYTLDRGEVLALQLADERLRRCRAELELATRNLREAEQESNAVRTAMSERVTEAGKYELVGLVDAATGKGKRRRLELHDAKSKGDVS